MGSASRVVPVTYSVSAAQVAPEQQEDNKWDGGGLEVGPSTYTEHMRLGGVCVGATVGGAVATHSPPPLLARALARGARWEPHQPPSPPRAPTTLPLHPGRMRTRSKQQPSHLLLCPLAGKEKAWRVQWRRGPTC